MSELNIKINIPNMGKAVGTLSWLKEELKAMEFKYNIDENGQSEILYKKGNDAEFHPLIWNQEISYHHNNDKFTEIEVFKKCITYKEYFMEDEYVRLEDTSRYIFTYLNDSAESYMVDLLNRMEKEFRAFVEEENKKEEEARKKEAEVEISFK